MAVSRIAVQFGWVRVGTVALACALFGCEMPPSDMMPREPNRLGDQVDMYSGSSGPVDYVVLDLGGEPQTFKEFLSLTILPQSIAKTMWTGQNAYQRGEALDSATLRPYEGSINIQVAGWELYDSQLRVAAIIAGLDERIGVSLVQKNAPGPETLTAMMHRLEMEGSDLIATHVAERLANARVVTQ